MDEVDRRLVVLLQADGRKTLQVLSEELGRPKTTIAARIKRLEHEGVIQGRAQPLRPGV
jgi:transcriptional regulator, AsnC family